MNINGNWWYGFVRIFSSVITGIKSKNETATAIEFSNSS